MAIPVRIMTALGKQLVDLSKNPSDGNTIKKLTTLAWYVF